MQKLPLPVTTDADEAVVKSLAQKDALTWKSHQASWIAAYKTYQSNGGDPFAVSAHDFGPGVAVLQKALYDNRKSSGVLARMRRQKGLKSCPVCGSPVTGHLDHYLPRDLYPEFSIMRANLVPACGHCNSGAKGTKVHGVRPRRFIHPYFDAWAAQPLWYVKIVPPFEAATFMPRPMPSLISPQFEIVEFHLKNVLGPQFHLSMDNLWSTLPRQIKLRDPLLTLTSVTGQVHLELAVALKAVGTNGWAAALFRGLAADPDAIQYMHQEALRAPSL